jgi:sulfate transport system ATP-binding protein
VTTILVTHDQEVAMEVADRIVLMNHGQIEQVGGPQDLYEHPTSRFVMEFIGPVNRLGDTYVRPHDIEIQLDANGSTSEAKVEHLVYLGFEVRVALALKDGRKLWAQVTREDARQLNLEAGKPVHVRMVHSKVFDKSAKDSPQEDPLPRP